MNYSRVFYYRSLWVMALKWIQTLYLLVLYYLVKNRLVMLLPYAVEKIPVLRVTAGEVVYNNRYVLSFGDIYNSWINYALRDIFFYESAVVPIEWYGPG